MLGQQHNAAGMEMSDATSERSTGTGKTGVSASSSTSGPIDVDGTVFLRVRQCPLSGVKNTDSNVIGDGVWGPSFSKHAIWNRGSSTNPNGRFERISVLTWEHGGFADQHPSIDDFVTQVKADQTLQKQFKAAYEEMVKIVTEGRIRFRAGEREKCKLRLESARKTVVTAHRTSQLTVTTKFRGVVKETYDKEHPGRIARQGLKVVKARCNGQLKDIVLVPLLPQDHFDVDAEDITGLSMSEVVDDGEATISEGQARAKFEGLAAKQRKVVESSLANAELVEQAEMSEAGQVREESDAESANHSSDVSDRECDLTFVRSSFLGDDIDFAAPVARPSAASQAKVLHRGLCSGAGQGFAPRSVASAKKALPLGRSVPSTPKTGGPLGSVKSDGVSVSSASTLSPGEKKFGRPSKFSQQPATEVLQKHGLEKIQGNLDEVKNMFSDSPFSDLLAAPEDLNSAIIAARRPSGEAHKATVALDIKVRKWTSIPDDVLSLLIDLRTTTVAYRDILAAIFFDANRKASADKVQKALDAMSSAGLAIPAAAHGVHFQLLVEDLARFCNVPDLVAAFDPNEGYLKDVQAKQSDRENLLKESLGNVLRGWVANIEITDGNVNADSKEMLNALCKLSEALSASPVASISSELALLSKALDHGSDLSSERQDAFNTLEQYAADLPNYHGVLKMMLAEQRWQSLCSWGNSGGGAADLCSHLADAFGKVCAPTFSHAEKCEFFALLRKGFSAIVEADGKGSKVRSPMLRVLQGLAEVGKVGPRNVEAVICEMCEILTARSGEPLQALQLASKRSKTHAADVEVRSVFDVDKVLAELPEETIAKVCADSSFDKAIEALKVQSANFACAKELFTAVHDITKLKLETSAGSAAEKGGRSALAKAWSQVQTKRVSLCSLGDATSKCLQTLESTLDLKAVGKTLYTDNIQLFSKALREALEAALALDATNFEDSSLVERVASTCAKVLHQRHQVLQACAWSTTPSHQRQCVISMLDVVIPVCKSAPQACRLESCTEKQFQLDEKVRSAFGALAMEDSRVRLASLVGEDLASRFFEKALAWHSAMQAAEEGHNAATISEIKKQAAALASMLAKEDKEKPLTFEEIASKFPLKTAQVVKNARLSLKTLWGKLPAAQQQGLAHEAEIITRAKNQSFKWGLSRFLTHEHLNFVSSEGERLRASLKDVWGVGNKDKDFLEYLGGKMKGEVEDALKCDTKKAEAKKAAKASKGSGGAQGEVDVAAPRRKRQKRA